MEHSGFFNAKLVDGVYDRLYNAKDYRDNLGAVISNGVRRSGDDDLKVQAITGSMNYTVAVGRAWINGGWYFNDSTWVGTVPSANVTLPRIDRVILRFNSNENVRSINIGYLQGTPSAEPSPKELTQTNEIFEICLADIYVGANAVTINQTYITDQRSNKEVCGWITTPVGYDDFFESIDNKVLEHTEIIDAQWQTMKDRWASVTLFKRYVNRIITDKAVYSVRVGITQYDPSGVDILDVFVNGIYCVKDVDYTAENDIVTFTDEKIIGTEIIFVVYKSIDGTGLGDVSDEVAELQTKVAELQGVSEWDYVCNGIDDNVRLSELCDEYFNGSSMREHLKINVHGNFVCSVPYNGDGTSVNRYKWINVSPTGDQGRRITLDFSNCSDFNIPMPDGSWNIVFHGKDMTVIGANVSASNVQPNTAIEAFSSTNGNVKAVRCRFNFTGYHKTFVAENGTFDNCIAECTVMNGEGYCFYTNAEGVIRLFGGEYKAYTLSSTSNAMGAKQTEAGAVLLTYGVNFPIVVKEAYRQTHAINATGGTAIVRDTISTLTVTAGTVNSTIALNKPGRG